MLFHRRTEPIPVEHQVAFDGHRLHEFRWYTVRLIKLCRTFSGNPQLLLGLNFSKDAANPFQARIDRSKKRVLFYFNDLSNTVNRFCQFRVGVFHHLHDARNQLLQERIPLSQLMSIQDSSPQ